MRGRLGALDRSAALGRSGYRGLPDLGCLGILQRLFTSDAQRERQRFLAFAHLLAGIHVEQVHRLQQFATTRDERGLNLGCRGIRVDDQRHIFLRHRCCMEHTNPASVRRSVEQLPKVDFDGARALR